MKFPFSYRKWATLRQRTALIYYSEATAAEFNIFKLKQRRERKQNEWLITAILSDVPSKCYIDSTHRNINETEPTSLAVRYYIYLLSQYTWSLKAGNIFYFNLPIASDCSYVYSSSVFISSLVYLWLQCSYASSYNEVISHKRNVPPYFVSIVL